MIAHFHLQLMSWCHRLLCNQHQVCGWLWAWKGRPSTDSAVEDRSVAAARVEACGEEKAEAAWEKGQRPGQKGQEVGVKWISGPTDWEKKPSHKITHHDTFSFWNTWKIWQFTFKKSCKFGMVSRSFSLLAIYHRWVGEKRRHCSCLLGIMSCTSKSMTHIYIYFSNSSIYI